MSEQQIEIAREWLSECCESSEDGRVCAYTIQQYIAQLEADKKRLEDLEHALKQGDVCGVTATDWIGPDKYKYIEIEFSSDREPVTRESLTDAIDEAMEEQEYD